ncbi:MAG: PleD family two-component system response regulator [Candidatus Kapaibacterium sp.]
MSEHPSHTASVLVVDDNVWMQRVLAKTLLSLSITPNLASNAYDAIGSAVNDNPHAIILDVVMPEIDGLQTLRILKSMNITRDIPVLVVTAAGDADSMGIALRLGADGFIRKPFTRASLQEKLHAVLPHLDFQRNERPPADIDLLRDAASAATLPVPDARRTARDTRIAPVPQHKDSPVRMSDSSLLRPGGRPAPPHVPPRHNPPTPPSHPWDRE